MRRGKFRGVGLTSIILLNVVFAILALQVNASKDATANGVAIDSQNNIIVTGQFYSDAEGKYIIRTEKYDGDGYLLWRKDYKSYNYNIGKAIAVDANDNIYVAGVVNESMLEGFNYILLKYNKDGDLQWTQTFDNTIYDVPYRIAVDTANHIFVTGASLEIDIAGGIFISDYWTIKCDSNGNLLKSELFNVSNADLAFDIAIDSNNDVIITGSSNHSGTMAYCTIKYDNNLGLKQIPVYYEPNDENSASGVAIDSADNIFVTGVSGSGGNRDYLTVKYGNDLSYKTNESYDVADDDDAIAIDVDSNDNVVITGNSNAHFCTVKYDNNLTHIWTVTEAFTGGARDVAVDSNDNIVVTGYGYKDDEEKQYYTIKYSPNGMVIWESGGEEITMPFIVYVDDDFNSSTVGWGYDHFNKIQDGINAVAENGTVYVFNGTYYEDVIVNKSINLRGESRDTTTIDGDGSGDVVYVSADWVNISNFTIRNSGYVWDDSGVEVHGNYNSIANTIISGNHVGIYLYMTHNTHIEDCILHGNHNSDISILDSFSGVISNCVSYDTPYGIVIVESWNISVFGCEIYNHGWSGIYLNASSNNTFLDCISYGNTNAFRFFNSGYGIISFSDIYNNTNGILLQENSNNNTISNCNILNNDFGIYVRSSSNNSIHYNDIYNNMNYGIYLFEALDNYILNCSSYGNDYVGIGIYNSSDNCILNCSLKDGIALKYAIHNSITNCNCCCNCCEGIPGSYGILLGYSENNSIESSICDNNTNGILFICSNNNTISNCNISSNEYGIWMESSHNNTICNSSICSNNWHGIYAWQINNNTIHNCNISDNYGGIHLYNSHSNFVRNCQFRHNMEWNGSLSLVESSNNVITNSTIADGRIGILALSSNENTVSNCNIYSNNDYGIWLWYSGINTILECNLSNNAFGINVEFSGNNTIFNCDISDSIDEGIYLGLSSNNLITNCVCYNSNYNMLLEGSSKNKIVNCTSYNAYNVGISFGPSSDNTITNCTIYSNQVGIEIGGSNNTILNCSVYDNSNYGVYSWFSSSNNLIHHNNFINNTNQSYDEGNNSWDNGYPCGGNYWDDYSGSDMYHGMNQNVSGSDRIGDTPYYIPGGNNFDRYPLLYPWGEVPPIANLNYFPLSPTTQDTIQFNDLSSDLDGTIASWYWIFGDGDTAIAQNPTHRYKDDGTYSVVLIVTDDDGATNLTHIPVNVLNVPPIADFTRIPIDPSTQDAIQFTDSSYDLDGIIVNWTWNFSDGNISYEQNPTHQYSDDGTYNVTLTVGDDDGATNTTYELISVANVSPVANFTYTPSSPTDLDTIQFTNLSHDLDGIIVNWTWNFSDGNISYEQNPTHQYSDDGTYNVTLTVGDDDDAINSTYRLISVVNVPPITNFSYTPVSPTTQDTIQFNGTSTDNDGYIVNWTWNFDDGNVSYEQNIAHKYADNGTYNVTLTVGDDDGAINSTYTVITVLNVPPTSNFTYTPESPTDLDIINFTDASTDNDGSVVNWTWDFGDGNMSTVRNPTYSYEDDGIYTITLTVIDDDGATDSIAEQITVANIPPVANFTYSPLNLTANDDINFIDKSTDADGTIIRWTWNFGDGTIRYIQNPPHKYAEKGTYNITLTVEDDDGDTDSYTIIVTVEKEEDGGIAGFETVVFIGAILVVLILTKKRRYNL